MKYAVISSEGEIVISSYKKKYVKIDNGDNTYKLLPFETFAEVKANIQAIVAQLIEAGVKVEKI